VTVTRIPVGGDSAPYDVVIGSGILGDVAGSLPAHATRVALMHPEALGDRAADLAVSLAAPGREVITIELPDGEATKTAEVAYGCWEALGRNGFTRTDVIVGLGGGATTDLAGFVAGTWLRGVAVVLVPTTLLAMVDAAVGGKTGINTASGKNLVGVIHEPAAVVIDTDWLATLPSADLVAGLAEVIKTGFIADPAILDVIEADPAGAVDPHSAVLRELIERSVSVKARVVSADVRERIGDDLGREVLNYGHTFGHAIERAEDYRWRHGDAVAVGMLYVAAVARAAGLLPDEVVERHRSILASVGLPTSYVLGRWDELRAAMRVDKKARGDELRFVVLEDVGRPRILRGPDEGVLRAAYEEVCR
jgi:3-dehydroquinate synthase